MTAPERLSIRPATPADALSFNGEPFPLPAWATTVRKGERIIGIGGIAVCFDGRFIAFAHLSDEARHHPVTLHKMALRTLALARAMGAEQVFAVAQKDNPAAVRWLDRLGFSLLSDRVYVCSA